VVPNFVQPNSLSEEETIRGVATAERLETAPVALHRFIVHREGSLRGKTAQELEPNSKAAAEINALWDWLYARLQMTNPATVHKVA